MSENIGILVSTKPGQNKLKQAMDLKQRLDKNSFILLSKNKEIISLGNYLISSVSIKIKSGYRHARIRLGSKSKKLG